MTAVIYLNNVENGVKHYKVVFKNWKKKKKNVYTALFTFFLENGGCSLVIVRSIEDPFSCVTSL